MIEVNDLVFEYPGTRALDDVSFSVRPGEITALVGPNGAGKTTLLKCLAALDQPIAGDIRVDGVDVLKDPRLCHERVGYLADFFGLYQDLTLQQCLRYAARAHNIEAVEEEKAVQKAARRLHIEGRLQDKVHTLSRGLSQRLAIAQSIIHEPAVLMLDEPASGLDPEARAKLSSLFIELSQQGITIIVSSHILAELEEYCTSMLVVRDGKIIEHRHVESPELSQSDIHIELSSPVEDLQARLEGIDDVTVKQVDDSSADIFFAGDKQAQTELLKHLLEGGMPVCSLYEKKTSLQDTYLAHVETGGEKI